MLHPAIDPAYFRHPLDIDMAARAILHVISFTEIELMKSVFRRDNDGKVVIAKSSGDKLPTHLEEAKDFARGNTVTEYHPVSTCAMLSREKGGVVSDELRVYGTSNIRVVDASIFPTPVQGNIISLVYALAEKAAGLIKGELGGTARANEVNEL
jgi:choline dehydrogenase-like flavoprotein